MVKSGKNGIFDFKLRPIETSLPKLPPLPPLSIPNEMPKMEEEEYGWSKCTCLCHMFGQDCLHDSGETCFMCGCIPKGMP